MMMPHKIFTIAIILLLINARLFGQAKEIMDYSHSLEYANYLFNSKQYKISAIEYERVTFLEPSDTLAKLRLIQSYRLAGDIINAKARLINYFPNCQSNCPEVFALENIHLLFMNRQYYEAYRFLEENSTIKFPRKVEFEIGAMLMQYQWKDAQKLASDFLSQNKEAPTLNNLNIIATNGGNLRYKSPISAALMSAILPGSGKLYTKHWADGIYAFAFVSAFSCLAYKSIKNKGMNTGSILYGSVALSFYAANIYGSHKSAVRYNQKANRLLTKDVENMLFE